MTTQFAAAITLITRTVTGQDGYGNDILGETSTSVLGVFAPGSSTELVQGQDLVVAQPGVFLPAGTDVSSVDAVEVGGVRYEVDGSPNVWTSPFTGRSLGVAVRLKAVTG